VRWFKKLDPGCINDGVRQILRRQYSNRLIHFPKPIACDKQSSDKRQQAPENDNRADEEPHHSVLAFPALSLFSAAPSGCVMGKEIVPSLGGLVARKAGLEQRLVGVFAVFELSEPPAARRSIFS
jgi:hypothetical protein